jgi:TldD protein
MARREFLIRSGGVAAGVFLCRTLAGDQAFGFDLANAAAVAPPERLDAWLENAVERLEKTYPYAYALYTLDEGITITANRSGLTVTRSGPREGVVFGVLAGVGLREEATSFVDERGIERAVTGLLSGGVAAAKGGPADPGPPLRKVWTERGTIDAASVPLPRRVDDTRALHARLLARQSGILSASVETTSGTSTRIFVNRARRLEQTLGRGGITASVMIESLKGGTPGAYWIRQRGVGGLELTSLDNAAIDLLFQRAGRLAGAPSPEPGETIVVSEPAITGTLAHESFGHGVEVDMFARGRARAADFLGKRVGSDQVRIEDDPTRSGTNGFYHFDDEGMTAAPTVIVDRGIFLAGLTDLMSAAETKLPRTANGRRESYDHKAYSRMSNTFFAPGTLTLEELLSGVSQGILIGTLRAGMEDPKGWGIQIVAQYGEEIRNGRLTGKVVSPVTLSGYVPDVLASVDGSTASFSISSGTCGKGSKESVPVGMGGPHLRFRARVS